MKHWKKSTSICACEKISGKTLFMCTWWINSTSLILSNVHVYLRWVLCFEHFKGTCWLGLVELVFVKHLKPFVMNCITWFIYNLSVDNNDPHKHALKLHGFPIILQSNTVRRFVESKVWLHKMVDRIRHVCFVCFLFPTITINNHKTYKKKRTKGDKRRAPGKSLGLYRVWTLYNNSRH